MFDVPYVIHRGENGDERAVSLSTRLLADRIVMVDGEINENLATSVVMQLRYLESEDPNKPITMFIQSPGGHISAGYAIIDTMKALKCPVHTRAIGMVASMATTLFINGEKGHRVIYPHGELLVHQPLGGAQGQASDMKIHVDHILKLKQRLAEEYAELTGISVEKMLEMMDRDNILTAEEAVELGFADSIQQ